MSVMVSRITSAEDWLQLYLTVVVFSGVLSCSLCVQYMACFLSHWYHWVPVDIGGGERIREDTHGKRVSMVLELGKRETTGLDAGRRMHHHRVSAPIDFSKRAALLGSLEPRTLSLYSNHLSETMWRYGSETELSNIKNRSLSSFTDSV